MVEQPSQQYVHTVQFRDNPAIQSVPALTAANVVHVITRCRDDEHAAFTAVAVDKTTEVDGPSTVHDGGVWQRWVPGTGGGSTQTGDDAPHNRVSRPPRSNEPVRQTEQSPKHNYDPGVDRSAGKYVGHRSTDYDVQIGVGSSVVVHQQISGDVAALDDVRISEVG